MKKFLFYLSFAILLTIVSCSRNSSRLQKSAEADIDSILVLVNGEEWRDFPQELLTDGFFLENGTAKGIFSYFADRGLCIKSAVFWKGEKGEHVKEFYRRKYADRVNNGILDIGVEPIVKPSDSDFCSPVKVVGRVHREVVQKALVNQKALIDESELWEDDFRSNTIGALIPFSLAFINGEKRTDFPEEDYGYNYFYGIDVVKEFYFNIFTHSELEEILKRRNLILDDVQILIGKAAIDKYHQEGFDTRGVEKGVKAVYEIKAHPINRKGEIFSYAEEMPQFPDGVEALSDFIDDNIRYTRKMVWSSVHGRVIVECVIGKDGSVEEPQISKNLLRDKLSRPCTDSVLNKQCEDEALRVVGMMPRWKPSKNEKGEAVRVRVYIPVIF